MSARTESESWMAARSSSETIPTDFSDALSHHVSFRLYVPEVIRRAPASSSSCRVAFNASAPRATKPMRAPRWANARAVARPTPEVAPVITTASSRSLTPRAYPASAPPQQSGQPPHKWRIELARSRLLIAPGLPRRESLVIVTTF